MKCKDGCDNSVRIIYQDKDITILKCDECGGEYTFGTSSSQSNAKQEDKG